MSKSKDKDNKSTTSQSDRCETCRGSGKVPRSGFWNPWSDNWGKTDPCEDCGGSGKQ